MIDAGKLKNLIKDCVYEGKSRREYQNDLRNILEANKIPTITIVGIAMHWIDKTIDKPGTISRKFICDKIYEKLDEAIKYIDENNGNVQFADDDE